MSSDILKFERFGVASVRRVVLVSIDRRSASTGVTTLMGPVGVGKSTPLRMLAGSNRGAPIVCALGTHYERSRAQKPARLHAPSEEGRCSTQGL